MDIEWTTKDIYIKIIAITATVTKDIVERFSGKEKRQNRRETGEKKVHEQNNDNSASPTTTAQQTK